jgi:hypothetical protein
MTSAALLFLALTIPAADKDAKDTKDAPKTFPPAKVTVTGELACLHCGFGVGDSCCSAIKIDDKTPLQLKGKVADELKKDRFDKKTVVAEGTLSVSKDKVLVLTVDKAHFLSEKEKAPPAGEARITGVSACASCDLKLTDDCKVAFRNGEAPILLDGKLSEKCAEGGKTFTATGKLSVDKDGHVRLDAKTVEPEKDTKGGDKPADEVKKKE